MKLRSIVIPRLAACVLALPLSLFAACGDGAAVPEEGTEAAPTIEPTEAVEDLTLGGQVAPDGAIVLGANTDAFHQGDPIFLAMEVDDAVVDKPVRVEWVGPRGDVVETETQWVLQDQIHMSFALRDTAAFELGTYRVRVFYDGARVGEVAFEVEPIVEEDE